jgi:hypothetical protein
MDGKSGNGETRLSPKQAAELLRVDADTLYRWRRLRVGPPYYRRVGRIFYLEADLRRWEFSNPGE